MNRQIKAAIQSGHIGNENLAFEERAINRATKT